MQIHSLVFSSQFLITCRHTVSSHALSHHSNVVIAITGSTHNREDLGALSILSESGISFLVIGIRKPQNRWKVQYHALYTQYSRIEDHFVANGVGKERKSILRLRERCSHRESKRLVVYI